MLVSVYTETQRDILIKMNKPLGLCFASAKETRK